MLNTIKSKIDERKSKWGPPNRLSKVILGKFIVVFTMLYSSIASAFVWVDINDPAEATRTSGALVEYVVTGIVDPTGGTGPHGWFLEVPDNAKNLRIRTSGGTGDVYLGVYEWDTVNYRFNVTWGYTIGTNNEEVFYPTIVDRPTYPDYYISVGGLGTPYAGVTLYVSYDPNIPVTDPGAEIPPDADGFLQFLNKDAPRNNEGVAEGEAYYDAIDPNRRRRTLRDFKAFNDLDDSEVAVYVNDADLGFGRRMYVSKNPDGSIASCVENFAPLNPDGSPNVDAAAQEKLDLAKAGRIEDIVATVCMEYSGTPNTTATGPGNNVKLAGRKYVKFFAYKGGRLANGVPNDGYLTQADLDGRGAKTQPGLCNTCHGGQGKALVNGVYPDNGDTGAQFLPWDLNTFLYDPAITRSSQEGVFKRFNSAVIDTYAKPVTLSSSTPLTIPAGARKVTSSISVSNVSDPITSIVVSIDENAQGGPGLSYSDIDDLNILLISPAGKTMYVPTYKLSFASGIKNYYVADSSGERYGVVGADGNLTGLVEKYDGFVNNSTCLSQTPVPATYYGELGCTSANGTWKIEIRSRTAQGFVSTGELSKWSIHFNGMPETAYLPTPVELIRGWYGGSTLPNATFNGNFVPDGWKRINNPGAVADTEELYLEVMGPTCRACHSQRGTPGRNEITFRSYSDFMLYADQIQSLVFDRALMPMAKRTYESHFWNGPQPGILAKHMPDLAGVVRRPGENVANAGISRINGLGVRTGDIVYLNGGASQFPAPRRDANGNVITDANGKPVPTFDWRVYFNDVQVQSLSGQKVSFRATEIGDYTVVLNTGDSSTESTITVSSATTNLAPMSFKNDIIDYTTIGSTLYRCRSCHSDASPDGFDAPGRIRMVPKSTVQADIDEAYRIIRDRTSVDNLFDSQMVKKATGTVPHVGGTIWDSLSNADRFTRWTLEGAKNN